MLWLEHLAQDLRYGGRMLRRSPGYGIVLGGIVIGLAVSLALTRAMHSLLFEAPSSDPLTYCGVALLLAAVALAAGCLPASRAARVHPMLALRND